MLASTPTPRMITRSQSIALREKLLLGLVVIGMMIVRAAFLSLVTEGLLWLEGYFRDQSEFNRLVSIIGLPASFCLI